MLTETSRANSSLKIRDFKFLKYISLFNFVTAIGYIK